MEEKNLESSQPNSPMVSSMYTFHNFSEERMGGDDDIGALPLHPASTTHATLLSNVPLASNYERGDEPCHSGRNKTTTGTRDANGFLNANNNNLFSPPLMHELVNESNTHNVNFSNNLMHARKADYYCAPTYASPANVVTDNTKAVYSAPHGCNLNVSSASTHAPSFFCSNQMQCTDMTYQPTTAAGRHPVGHKNLNTVGFSDRLGGPFLKADEKNAILEMLPSVNSNNLRGSLRQFELALKMYGVNNDRDKQQLALRYFPKFIADVFFENAESSSGYEELRDIIVANSQQLYACHDIKPVETRTWDPFSVFRKADHMLSCPREEWQKEIITQLSPPIIQNELRLIMDLNLNDFKNRYKAIFNCFKMNGSFGSQINPVHTFNTTQQIKNRQSIPHHPRRLHIPQQQNPVMSNNQNISNNMEICFFHRKYGRDAYSCSGENCAMHPPTGVRPANQGNDTGGR